MTIIAPDLARRIDFNRLERIPTSFIPDNLRKQESDLLFRSVPRVFDLPFLDPRTQQTREIWIYLLIEHQSTPDPSMGFRILFYMLQVWDLQRRQWVADELLRSESLRPVSQ